MNSNRRFFVLDLVRGIAVLLMVLTHSIYFFHNRDNSFILSLETLGNTLCFGLFLFVSGATLYVAYLREEIDKGHVAKRLFRRILLLLITYYLLAFFVTGKELLIADFVSKAKIAFDILIFRQLPPFTEYIPPFIAATLFVKLLPAQLAKIARSITKTLFYSVVLYLIGYLLNHVGVPAYLAPWKAFLVGGEGLYRFPIFQYAPVFLVGLYTGAKLLALEGRKSKMKFFGNSAIITALAFVAVSVVTIYFTSFNSLLLRWPPSPAFLLLGIFVAFFLCYLFYLSKNFAKLPVLRDFMFIYGQNAYALFWTHLFLLSFYQMAGGEKFSSPLIILILFIALAVLSVALATFLPFNFKLSLTLNRDSHEEQEDLLESQAIVHLGEELAQSSNKEWRFLKHFFFIGSSGEPRQKRLVKKRHILLISILALLTVFSISPSVIRDAETNLRENKKIEWWGDEYAYRQNIRITNKEAFTNLVKGEKIKIVIDHATLVDKYQADLLGRDLTLAYFDGKNTNQLDFRLQNGWNLHDTTLVVTLPTTIQSHSDNIDMYLYFGGLLRTSAKSVVVETDITKSDYRVQPEKAENYQVIAAVDKRWKVFSSDGTIPEVTFSVKTDLDLNEPTVSWHLLGSELTGIMSQIDHGLYEVKIPISNFAPGMYELIADIKDGDQIYQSQKCGFVVSEPLYVSWTIDWEGYDAKDSYLTAMEKISADRSVPMTHYWNPRIYVTDTISSATQERLTDWLKSRLDKGDGFGLHIHAFYDLVASAGVEVRKTPNWGDNGDGYGVLLTAYTPEELAKIVQKSKELFAANGLPDPVNFRAGAWFADINTLTTLSTLGFRTDSSGRDQYDFGRNKIAGTWELQPISQPYFPSETDQNKSGVRNLSIMEVPDNGADSYWFTADQMIDRFKQNYPTSVVLDKTQFTFLSHPHWFDTDEQQRVISLLNYIDQYRADKDSGPVIFTTVDTIANAWEK